MLWPGVTLANASTKFKRAVDKARKAGHDIPEGISLHSLRHTFATALKLAGVDLDDIRRLLGYSDQR